MPSLHKKLLQSALAPVLKAAGFRKDGATWRMPASDTITVLNLQGSQWSPSFYVNLGVYFRALGDNSRPLEHQCHLRTRLGELVPDRHQLNRLLDFEHPLPDDARLPALGQLVTTHAIPWLARVSTLDGAREWCATIPAHSPWVTAAARELLNARSGV